MLREKECCRIELERFVVIKEFLCYILKLHIFKQCHRSISKKIIANCLRLVAQLSQPCIVEKINEITSKP